jgi:hypothetical protein
LRPLLGGAVRRLVIVDDGPGLGRSTFVPMSMTTTPAFSPVWT